MRSIQERPFHKERRSTFHYIEGLVQEKRNPSALAMGLRLSCTKPSISGISLFRQLINVWPTDMWNIFINKSKQKQAANIRNNLFPFSRSGKHNSASNNEARCHLWKHVHICIQFLFQFLGAPPKIQCRNFTRMETGDVFSKCWFSFVVARCVRPVVAVVQEEHTTHNQNSASPCTCDTRSARTSPRLRQWSPVVQPKIYYKIFLDNGNPSRIVGLSAHRYQWKKQPCFMECDNHFFWLHEWRYICHPGGHCYHPGALSLNQGTATDLKIDTCITVTS